MKESAYTMPQRLLPHLAALLAGVVMFWAWTPLLQARWTGSSLTQALYFILLMAAPLIGALPATSLQRRMSAEKKRQVLFPYLWWAVSGLVVLFLLAVAAQLGGGFVTVAFWGILVMSFLVPVAVPLLRTVVWLVSPPSALGGTE